MSTAIVQVQDSVDSKIDLIKRTVAVGADNDELEMFLYHAKKTGLDPLARQIYLVKRWNSAVGRETMTIQTGIDGYRVIADRTGKYAPGRAPVFEERDGTLYSATAFVQKLVGNKWHEVSATAFWSEYVQTTKDKQTGKYVPTKFWQKMGHTMLAKCAEALCLRKAFPADLSGIFTAEEMMQADNEESQTKPLVGSCCDCGAEIPPYKTKCEKCLETPKALAGAVAAPETKQSAASAEAVTVATNDSPSLSELRGKVLNQKTAKGKTFWELDGKRLLWHETGDESPNIVGRILECTAHSEGLKRGFNSYRLHELIHVSETTDKSLEIQEQDLVPILEASVKQAAEKKKMPQVPKDDLPF